MDGTCEGESNVKQVTAPAHTDAYERTILGLRTRSARPRARAHLADGVLETSYLWFDAAKRLYSNISACVRLHFRCICLFALETASLKTGFTRRESLFFSNDNDKLQDLMRCIKCEHQY